MNQPRFYKVVRFKTGENLLCQMTRDVRSLAQESYLKISRPALAVAVGYTGQKDTGDVFTERFAIRPWLDVSDSEEYTIGLDLVLTIGDMKPSMVKQYEEYWKNQAEVMKVIELREFRQYAKDAVEGFLLSMSSNGEVTIIQEDDEPQ